jgi:hypothetical protein
MPAHDPLQSPLILTVPNDLGCGSLCSWYNAQENGDLYAFPQGSAPEYPKRGAAVRETASCECEKDMGQPPK